ncbi:MAG: hypothetical protein HC930_10590 [Hydrococcus sp. SU_1_0]|nr:hypothetical protein [Hydrococcus sp. SU_1_0]
MTKSIQQVKHNLEILKSQVAETATELEELHCNYLELLSHSLKQQLILACYQICTQLYPQSFINLSLSAKQDLQQNLRNLSTELKSQLADIVAQRELEPKPPELNLMSELIKKLPRSKSRTEETGEGTLTANELELIKAEIASIENIENLEDIELIAINASAIDTDSDEEVEPDQSTETAPREQVNLENPEHLILWHQQIERGIKRTLDETSRKVNRLLQKSKIIPDRLPNQVIDMAMQADGDKGMRNNLKLPQVPHVMSLTVEADKSKQSQSGKKSLQISLLRLRLAELEFSDHLLNAKRGQLRNLMSKVNKLDSQYQAIQQELAIIEAQAAWRSSWYED